MLVYVTRHHFTQLESIYSTIHGATLSNRERRWLGRRNVAFSLCELIKTTVLKHHCCERKVSYSRTEPRTPCVLTTGGLHCTTEATWGKFFQCAKLAEHNYMKYKFRKRLTDTWAEPRTLNMLTTCFIHCATEPMLPNQGEFCYVI